MDKTKVYFKTGLAAAAGLLLIGALSFNSDLWNSQKQNSPHYRIDACGVCHPEDKPYTLKAPELDLCTSCHEREGDVVVRNAEGKDISVDLGRSHPFGVYVTQEDSPATLPLTDGQITCQTCHDVHLSNSESHMLRLYGSQPSGFPDWTPLCHDCHPTY